MRARLSTTRERASHGEASARAHGLARRRPGEAAGIGRADRDASREEESRLEAEEDGEGVASLEP